MTNQYWWIETLLFLGTVIGFSDFEAFLDDFTDSNYEYLLKKEVNIFRLLSNYRQNSAILSV